MPALVDTHCHLDFEAFDGDREAVVARARQAGVVRAVLVAVDVPSAERCARLASASGGWAVASAGLHPNEPTLRDRRVRERIASLLRAGGFAAVGETGLDCYRDGVGLDDQVVSLRAHIEWSLELRLPVILHCRDAFAPLLDVVADYRGAGLAGVLHCFTGTASDAAALVAAGLHVGAGGIATFRPREDLRAALDEVPDDRLLLETDAPFLAPTPVRGRRNEPAFVAHTAAHLARHRGVDLERLARLTTRNADLLFGLALAEPAADAPTATD